MKSLGLIIFVILFYGLQNFADSQAIISGQDTSGRTIITAFPFLTIAPDARSAGLGNSGAANTNNLAPMHWNVAGLSFLTEEFGASFSRGPWLNRIINGMALGYFTAYYKIKKNHAIGGSFRNFNLGNIFFTPSHSNPQTVTFKPREFALDLGYSYGLSKSFSGGVAIRYIHSNLAGNFSSSTIEKRIVNSLGFDIGLLYVDSLRILRKNSELAFGMVISNLGSGVIYRNEDNKDPMPANLRIGTSISIPVCSAVELNFNLDFNKLLVPTPPVYETDPGTGELVVDANGDPVIKSGRDPDVGFLPGIAASFADAPDGIEEELQEISIAFGLELSYREKYTIRTGYFYESEFKGNRKFMTIGAGYRLKNVGVDFSYLIPEENNSPLSNTFRLSITYTSS